MTTRAALAVVVVAAVAASAGRHSPASSGPMLIGGDDIPAEFAAVPLAGLRVPDWCGTDPADAATPTWAAGALYVSAPAPGAQASIENLVYRFRPGDARRFVDALRTGDHCAAPTLRHPDGVTIAGSVHALPMQPLGDDLLAHELDGVATGSGLAAGAPGRMARVVVQHGDYVAVVIDAAYGTIAFDSGLRNRLAALAVGQLPP